jgi:TonB family protein
MRTALFAAGGLTAAAVVLAGGCAGLGRSPPARAAVQAAAAGKAEQLSPFDESPVSFFVSGLHFSLAQAAMVRLCVTSDGHVTSATLLTSSGDERFDDLALLWARRVRLRSTPGGEPAKVAPERCGPVRVELHTSPARHGLGGPSESVG